MEMKTMARDNAVSPVIGSILLVAITVIIAAVIAAFVFGMTGDIQQTRVVAITSDISQNDAPLKVIVITNHGGKDASVLVNATVEIDRKPCTPPATAGAGGPAWTQPSYGDFATTVGLSLRCNGASPGVREHLVVTGTFVDGTQQVLLDTYQ